MKKYSNCPDTQIEIESMLTGRVELITKRDLLERLEVLGYEIDPNVCFNYRNVGNPGRRWNARSIGYRNISDKMGYAHYKNKNPNLKQLQEIRRNCFCVIGGRIWEL